MQLNALQIASMLGGSVEGNPEKVVNSFAKIEEAADNALSFIANPKYAHFLYSTNAGVLLVNETLEVDPNKSIPTLIRVKDAYTSLAKLLQFYQQSISDVTPAGVHQTAVVLDNAQIDESVHVGALSFVGEGVVIGANSVIHPQVYLGKNVKIGKNVSLFPGVKIYHNCVINDFVTIHAGTVIGADGFGFAPQQDGSYDKVPQIGNVIIESYVEIGANTTIDRATMGSTIIRSGVKLDNLIQVAHNVEIGEKSVIAAQTGISGSTKLGAACMVGGQVGIIGHLNLQNGTKIAAQSGVTKDTKEENIVLQGSPAGEARGVIKSQAAVRKLPELYQRINELEAKLNQLLSKLEN